MPQAAQSSDRIAAEALMIDFFIVFGVLGFMFFVFEGGFDRVLDYFLLVDFCFFLSLAVFCPAGVIRPRCSRSLMRARFRSVQWLFTRRGEIRCASRPSGIRLTVESIHPKHSASSTTAR